MTRFILILALAVGCFSCNQTENKTETKTETQATQTPDPNPLPAKEDLTPDVITDIPAGLSGCKGMFTYDSVALNKGNYVFVYDQEGKAVLQIDGKTITLQEVEKTEPAPGQKQMIFSAGQHKVILNTRKDKQTATEEGNYTGTLEIYKDVSEQKLKVHGSVTCK